MDDSFVRRNWRFPATIVLTAVLAASFVTLDVVVAAAAAGDINGFAGNASAGYSGDGGQATLAQLNTPFGVASDAAGNVFVADCGNQVVRKIDVSGVITTVAGNNSSGYSGDGGPATAAQLRDPCGVAVDAAGNVLIADTSNRVVRKVDSSGTISTIAGTGTYGYAGDGGPATAATFSDIYRVLPVGTDLYIADYQNNVVRKVDGSGTVTTFAGNGGLASSGDGGPATAAEIASPVGLAVDGSSNIYVVQTDEGAGNNRVRKIDTSGTISTFAGTGDLGGSGDGGPATQATLANPFDIVFDSAGRATISDYLNNRLRRVTASGLIYTVVGSGVNGYFGDGASACSARLQGPTGVALGPTGDLFFADSSNNVVRRVSAPLADCVRGVAADFDGDRVADVSVYRPSAATWFVHPSSGGADTSTGWGAPGDIAVPADYDGDLRTDIAIYRPSTGLWAIRNSSGGDTFITFGGVSGDLAVPGDYDGDGKADVAVFRPSSGFWFIHRSTDNSDHAAVFGGGVAGDIPVQADFDGDGRTDIAIFRSSTGAWFVHPSGSDQQDYAVNYGSSGDIPLVAKYDTDAKADIAVFRPSTGLWAVHNSTGAPDTFVTYGGVSGDIPVPADYDGDHRADIAIFRPTFATWFVHRSTNGADALTTFGIPGDKPLALPAAVASVFFP